MISKNIQIRKIHKIMISKKHPNHWKIMNSKNIQITENHWKTLKMTEIVAILPEMTENDWESGYFTRKWLKMTENDWISGHFTRKWLKMTEYLAILPGNDWKWLNFTVFWPFYPEMTEFLLFYGHFTRKWLKNSEMRYPARWVAGPGTLPPIGCRVVTSRYTLPTGPPGHPTSHHTHHPPRTARRGVRWGVGRSFTRLLSFTSQKSKYRINTGPWISCLKNSDFWSIRRKPLSRAYGKC